DVAHRRSGSVGIPPIGDHLNLGRHAGKQPPLELLVKLYDEQRAPIVDVIRHFACSSQVGHAIEHAGAVELGQQSAGGGGAILVERGVRHVVEVVGCRVA